MTPDRRYQGESEESFERRIKTAEEIAGLKQAVLNLTDQIKRLETSLTSFALKNEEDHDRVWKSISALRAQQAKTAVWIWILGVAAGAAITTLVTAVLTKALH